MFKIGDKVKIIKGTMWENEFGTVTGCIGDKYFVRIGDMGEFWTAGCCLELQSKNNIIRGESSKHIYMGNIPKTKCKVGDRVRIFQDKWHEAVGIVTRTEKDRADIEFVKDPPEKDFPYILVCGVSHDNIRIVSQCDTFKIGDRIKVNAPYADSVG